METEKPTYCAFCCIRLSPYDPNKRHYNGGEYHFFCLNKHLDNVAKGRQLRQEQVLQTTVWHGKGSLDKRRII